ncbi:hypothetical protein GCM10011514_47750 [Emticicia aquatilis]|uniref:Peptidase M4 C-terminal domain-containing protein n=2 Tax=Emticicia aquatilis TaxID=1537369 RepID=A0A916Z610_9BACT|nr:hypothetical protein GCM10011514_47750 [Emticicia aquatilis]
MNSLMQKGEEESLPVAFVPTPTQQYRQHRKVNKVTKSAGLPIPIPVPFPRLNGHRVLIWKQDPSVTEIGIRKVFMPNLISSGPRNSRITSQGLPPVSANAFGDFIQTPGTDQFDAVHTFSIVQMTLKMVQRALSSTGNPIPWQWNSAVNTEPLQVFAHGLPDTMNAFYSRGQKALKFGDFIKPGSNPPQRIFTCRSLDIVAHETGHAILDGLKPNWITSPNPQAGGLHESFGDLMAIFLTLSQLDQVEAIIAQTKANLHDKTFLADMAEEFGLALGRPNGLRNADNDLKMSEVTNEVHAISQVFTGAIYDILADIFASERNTAKKDDAQVLLEVGQYLLSVVLRAILASPNVNPTYANLAIKMKDIVVADGKPVHYKNAVVNRFTVREIVVPALGVDGSEILSEGFTFADNVEGNFHTCCGCMQLEEYRANHENDEEAKELAKWLKKHASDEKNVKNKGE